MDAGHTQVSYKLERPGPACVISVGGELTLATERGFAMRTAETLAAFSGPVFFDLSGLTFVDRPGARALARAVDAAAPRVTGLRGCSPAVRQVLTALGFDLPQAPAPVRGVPAASRPPADAGPLSRGDALTAQARATQATARQSASRGSEVMSRLAATYAELALSSRYRTEPMSTDRRRLLALSEQARALSRRYQQHAAPGAG